MTTSQRGDNLKKIAQASVDIERKMDIPAELLAAQCIIETGWLAKAPGHNCFGIKVYPGADGRQLLSTTEWFTPKELEAFLALGDGREAIAQDRFANGRQRYSCKDWFATFPSLSDCFAKRAALFTAGRYAPFAAKYKVDKDFTALVRGIAPIYATDPKYADTVLAIANQANVQAALKEERRLFEEPYEPVVS